MFFPTLRCAGMWLDAQVHFGSKELRPSGHALPAGRVSTVACPCMGSKRALAAIGRVLLTHGLPRTRRAASSVKHGKRLVKYH